MTRYFGTDGVRGIANEELTCEVAFALGVAAAEQFGKRLVIGRDTRRSGSMLEAALVAGITAAGSDTLMLGIIPTPAVAYFAKAYKAAGGVVISASHNPPEYNGIKFFDAEGFKISSAQEEKLEERLQELLEDKEALRNALTTGEDIGVSYTAKDAPDRYIAHALTSVEGRLDDLQGYRIALDCAHGASALTTPQALSKLKAKVLSINTDFNGNNINVNSGSTYIDLLVGLVSHTRADIGIAHDGDADRLIAVDKLGYVVDGDIIEMICARDMLERGALPHNTIVTTVMCNLGLLKAAEELGIKVVQTPVGDSNVLEAMREGGYALGGEQSGHTIFLEHNTTGDGLVTALQLLAIMKTQNKTLHELAQVMRTYPQVLINVPVAEAKRATLADWEPDPEIKEAIEQAEQELKSFGGGRVLVRASGTEPVIRVMVEADTEEDAQQQAAALAAVVRHLYDAEVAS